jgi:hypothetical protein
MVPAFFYYGGNPRGHPSGAAAFQSADCSGAYLCVESRRNAASKTSAYSQPALRGITPVFLLQVAQFKQFGWRARKYLILRVHVKTSLWGISLCLPSSNQISPLLLAQALEILKVNMGLHNLYLLSSKSFSCICALTPVWHAVSI